MLDRTMGLLFTAVAAATKLNTFAMTHNDDVSHNIFERKSDIPIF